MERALTMKTRMLIGLPPLAALIFLVLGIASVLECRRAGDLATRNELLQEAIAEAEEIEDNQAALRAYQAIVPSLPEVELRILQRQWLEALEILHQVQLAKYNLVLEKEVPALYTQLVDHLDSVKERCGTLLTEEAPVRNEVAWRVHNIEGAARLLSAFTVLETERNWKKVMSAMGAAILAFKSAIETVDATPLVLNLEKSVPRWNLELLHADIYVKEMMQVPPDQERLGLRDNLEAVIPERGGYAPGEPLERRIRK
jgi:hypothetical protein